MKELTVISAADEGALLGEIDRIVSFVDRVPDARLIDIAFTCSQVHGKSVLSVIASSVEELRARLVSARSRIATGTGRRLKDKNGTYYFLDHLLGEGGGKLAFVFPGVPSFYPDMLRELAVYSGVFRGVFDELEEALAKVGDFTPSNFIFPPADYYLHDADIFSSGAYAEALVSIYAGCSAMTSLLAKNGVVPDGVVGFAGGDLAAMMCSGAAGSKLSRDDRIDVIRDIYAVVSKAVNHGGLKEVAMITAVLRHPEELDSLNGRFPPDKFMLAVDFSPRQKTFCVAKDIEQDVMKMFAEMGVRTVRLALDRPFNTKLCASLVPSVKKFAAKWMKYEPVHDIYSCATTEVMPKKVRHARNDTAERWAQPVRFGETVRKMYADGYRVFLEVGPRGLMTSAVGDTLRDVPHAAIATNSQHCSSVDQLVHALAQLAALGLEIDLSSAFVFRRVRRLDFDSTIPTEVRRNAEMKLSRKFPEMRLFSEDNTQAVVNALAMPSGRGARAAARTAAVDARHRRQQQFDFGAMNPLISDATRISQVPGVSVEVTKTFLIEDMPFIGDFSLGNSQLSYSDPNLRGLTLLTLPIGVEIMAEVARLVNSNRDLVAIEELNSRRRVSFENGALTLFIRAEVSSSPDSGSAAVKVQVRDDSPNSAYTWPVMEAVFIFGEMPSTLAPVGLEKLFRPRSVHWSGRDVYPMRVCCGRRLRGVQFVELWGDNGIDYEIKVPQTSGCVSFTRMPMWVVNPLLIGIVTSGFQLWRSHERFQGAFSFPFHMHRLELFCPLPKEGAMLKCYMRYTDFTAESHLCDFMVTDGNGNRVMAIKGWEELAERYPVEYCNLVYQPATSYLSESFDSTMLDAPITDFSSAFITDIPYGIFKKDEELWLKTISRVVLSGTERNKFIDMTGSVERRTEWLFGRIVAKEAVRKYLRDFYQARWSSADVSIWPDEHGKPMAVGAWSDDIPVKLDISIAHTAEFVVAIVAANARIGVDVEKISRPLTEEFANGVLTPEEIELAAGAANANQTSIRFWCAKEAVSKALGTGIRYSPREMVISSYEADAGRITMRLVGAWEDAFKAFKGRDISVIVRTLREHALAFCFLPAALLPNNPYSIRGNA